MPRATGSSCRARVSLPCKNHPWFCGLSSDGRRGQLPRDALSFFLASPERAVKPKRPEETKEAPPDRASLGSLAQFRRRPGSALKKAGQPADNLRRVGLG